MNARAVAAALVLVPFLALTTVAVAQHGYLGIFAVGLRDTAGAQVFMDLLVSMTIAAGWLHQDATKRGANPWPWLVGTPFLGSVAPLGYLVWRGLMERR